MLIAATNGSGPATPANGEPNSTMRPAFLNPLFASAQTLAGIGPRLILLLKKCLGTYEKSQHKGSAINFSKLEWAL
ncbi:hypothetical protein [Hyphomicrobium sp.]|uniref:hypothetical protein n=1 Tax=Hyphomicrobium sp. TaxID=82 RepID=UPI001DA2747E|nr:hypothetical protein [Hyphomicrobium sp.]MBY0562238.1 hypothetical protein [Hyphomicrobium sp.]